MKARYALLCVAALLLAATVARAEEKAAGDAILGKWWFPKKNGKMEVRREKGVYFGKVVAYDKPGALDKYNPDPELAKRPFVGIDMLQDFTYDANKKEWSGGTIYDGDSGKTYSCTLWFEGADTAKLNARGYVGISLFGRTEVFDRVTAKDEQAEREKAAQEHLHPVADRWQVVGLAAILPEMRRPFAARWVLPCVQRHESDFRRHVAVAQDIEQGEIL